MKKKIFLLLFISIGLFGMAQENTPTIANTYFSTKSPYLFDAFISGQIYFSDNKTKSIDLNYHVVANEIHYVENKTLKTFSTTDLAKITKITIGDYVFIAIKGKIYEVLYANKASALKQRKPNVTNENPGAYGTTSTTSANTKTNRVNLDAGAPLERGALVNIGNKKTDTEIAIHESYRLLLNATVYPANKRGVLKMYSDKSDEVKRFIKEQKIKFRKETDLIKLLKHCETL